MLNSIYKLGGGYGNPTINKKIIIENMVSSNIFTLKCGQNEYKSFGYRKKGG
ncbi:hypothetical protein XNW1_3370003 [Xenorhabdus nematophila str. Websteri]|nr:hypothetical protein XNW1_3370003 [Xenorhabdus nematophila str. Websteri]